MNNKFVLGIESSCDDTSVALVKNFKVIDCCTISSAKLHDQYGGVMPEFAAREHETQFIPLLQKLFNSNNVVCEDISHISYTITPGLKSSLLTAKIVAQTLSLLFNKPLIPINHVYGHIFSPFITNQIYFPHLSLVISGKTTSLFLVKNFTDIKVLDSTNDNALGEVYDKVGRILSLPYPGGAEIDNLFNSSLEVPPLLKHRPPAYKPFSYSGILSATIRYWNQIKNTNISNKQEYLATVFQKWVIESLFIKVKYWIEKEAIDFLTISGGVALNKYLRIKFLELGVKVVFVDRKYASDNAAMIAFYASHLI